MPGIANDHLAETNRDLQRLNEAKVQYIVIGGCAIFLHGYERTTRDIDILIDASPQNIEKLKKALQDILPEACAELKAEDVQANTVVRMVGEDLVVDLIHQVGKIDYEGIWEQRIIETINGVAVPIANVDAMLELKRGVRDVDKKDYLFLKGKKELLAKQSK
ncbi:MAG: nucleotidyl transferase AbiEii/AbiGii toxin family protein [Gammaproteobacteria bacterium]|nr:nucleotidyl transferase AbiEii/AbiGii toxin family protein [Gammaproteobacteria bacterium]